MSGPLKEMFPRASFAAKGPKQAWLDKHDLMYQGTKEVKAGERLVPADPYVEDGVVYIHTIEKIEKSVLDSAEWVKVRRERNARLRNSDWRMLSDAPGGAQVRKAWATYRQELRDLTIRSLPIEWPIAPDGS